MRENPDSSREAVPVALLALPDPSDRAERHVWLRRWVAWLRADGAVPVSRRRFEAWVAQLEADSSQADAFRRLWVQTAGDLELAPWLADEGIAQQPSWGAELAHRLQQRLLPVAPTTRDAHTLLLWVFDDPRDERWLRALPKSALQRLVRLTAGAGADAAGPARWRDWVLDGLQLCVLRVAEAGTQPALRQRLDDAARRLSIFLDLPMRVQDLRAALQGGDATATGLAEQALRQALDDARHAAYSAYQHLQEQGIATSVVFLLRQLRQRVLRAKALLRLLRSPDPARATLHMLARLVRQGHEARSVRALWLQLSQLLAERVSQRSAETGEHYITRTREDFQRMFWRAAGGGAVLGLTTWAKFWLGSLGLAAFWSGLAAGVNYAFWFVVIMLLHFTVATKQPAMTAPAMAARLRQLDSREAVLRFVDEVAALVRSQAAAVLGNVLAVIPAVALLHWAHGAVTAEALIDIEQAEHVLSKHQLLGPTLLLAAGTGVLLFASSQIAGWAENAFVLHRLHEALAYHPRSVALLGAQRAQAWARWWLGNISGLAANISLGLMLGLVPVALQFFGVPFDVRHVTLVTGQMAAAALALGAEVWTRPEWWSAVAATLLVGPINVAVSFYLAFRLALRAQGVNAVNRARITQALRHRWRRAPTSFFWPPRAA
jgi:site-specific recombinase